MGTSASLRQQYDKAIPFYEEALRLAPKYELALNNLGRTYFAWGEMEGKVNHNLPKAAELFEKVFALPACNVPAFTAVAPV